jgi:hypothetical protein
VNSNEFDLTAADLHRMLRENRLVPDVAFNLLGSEKLARLAACVEDIESFFALDLAKRYAAPGAAEAAE